MHEATVGVLNFRKHQQANTAIGDTNKKIQQAVATTQADTSIGDNSKQMKIRD